jgi:hypothetical protein
MREEIFHIQCYCTVSAQSRENGRWRLAVVFWVLLICMFPGTALAIELGSPVRIGVLTASWGPPPHVMGLIG